MFAIALAASFDDTGSRGACVDDLLDAWPCHASDGRAVEQAPGAAAGVLRWAVVDRDRRVTPVWDPERRLLFVGDVRLYNRDELGRDLGVGDAAVDLTDADLAWRAYLRWGENAPRHLVGDFAFVVWNQLSRSIFAARDHLGIRPLYYLRTDRAVFLASDVRQLLVVTPRPATQIDARAILEKLLRGRRTSGLTFFRNISALPGGHVATIGPAGCEVRQYWVPSFAIRSKVDDDDRAEIRTLFRRAVHDRLASDHPIVAHLSGGFDSSAILMVAERIYADEPQRAPLVMASALTPGMPSDDSFYIDVVARRVRFESVRWNALETNLADLEAPVVAYPGVRRGMGGGFRRDLELLRQRDARVLLHGHFGDGLTDTFGLSRDLFRARSWRALARYVRGSKGPRAQARALVRAMTGILPPVAAVHVLRRVDNRSFRRPPEWAGPELQALYPLRPEELMLPDANWPSHIACDLWSRLTGPRTGAVIDAIVCYSSEEGVEVRLPYLDVRLVEKALSLPWRDRMPDGDRDRLSRETFRSFLPEEFKRRSRPTWTEVWVLGTKAMLPAVGRLVSDGSWLSAPYVQNREARTMFSDVCARPESDPEKLFLVYGFAALEAWLREVLRYDAAPQELLCPTSK